MEFLFLLEHWKMTSLKPLHSQAEFWLLYNTQWMYPHTGRTLALPASHGCPMSTGEMWMLFTAHMVNLNYALKNIKWARKIWNWDQKPSTITVQPSPEVWEVKLFLFTGNLGESWPFLSAWGWKWNPIQPSRFAQLEAGYGGKQSTAFTHK